ncbi:cyclin-dependent kinase inhibitor 1-like isoform X2 [Rhineura floridana]|uniref:cyclin-dependent kinase inhibitor 1-like isoform X2 n=2 Tax=Rhineura floridana TaxID=261503 RepID=UPI002AC83556|nr:cyclin-dependent kinase inhibitor 1-like isoform X2 [Rhineura floridana]
MPSPGEKWRADFIGEPRARPFKMELLLSGLINDRRKREGMEPTRCTKRSHVSRNLFGPVDHDHLQQDFQHMLCTSMENAKRRWNFDFLQEMPAEGLLQWEELQGHEVPTFYHTCVVREARRPLQSMNRAVARESKSHHNGKVIEKPRPAKKVAGKKRRQTTLTDYYTAKKQIRMDMQTPVKKSAF